jgi:glycine cleavage system H protein
MPDYLEFTADKFTFRVATDRLYTSQGVWVQAQTNARVRVGVADYLQQSSGDVAFASVKPAGTRLAAGAAFAEVETIKTVLELPSPVSGTVVEANPALNLTPEAINQDPYERGWLAVIEATDWGSDRAKLLEPNAYLSAMQSQVQADLKKP